MKLSYLLAAFLTAGAVAPAFAEEAATESQQPTTTQPAPATDAAPATTQEAAPAPADK